MNYYLVSTVLFGPIINTNWTLITKSHHGKEKKTQMKSGSIIQSSKHSKQQQKVKRHLPAYSDSAKSVSCRTAGKISAYILHTSTLPTQFWCPAPSSRHNLILLGNTRINILWIYVVRCIILILFAIWSGAAQTGNGICHVFLYASFGFPITTTPVSIRQNVCFYVF